jgi:hypothetical protein
MQESIKLARQIASLEAERDQHYIKARACVKQISTLKHTLATLPSEPTRKGRNWSEEQKQAQSERMNQRWERAREGTAGEEE